MDEALFKRAGEDGTTRFYYYDRETGAAVEWVEERIRTGGVCERADITDIPVYLQNAFIAMEDHRFYRHGGIDVFRTAKAAALRLVGKGGFGGSTITQQLAKNQFFTQKKQLTRKVAEIFMVQEIEKLYEKEEILELYMNSIYYGDGYYCIADASMGYFGKLPWQMNAYECTLLAGIPNAPSVYAPTVNPELAAQRQQQVISDMVRWGYLTENEAAQIAL
jgi:membrane peptidoglycan carboxypeptidase